MKDLREKTIRAGSVRLSAQGASFLLRIGSLMVLARLLDPKDFGLVSMVTAITGFLDLFRDFGLSAASIQRPAVTEEQTSTLFWINVLAGLILTMVASTLAPVIGAFYHEPRLFWVTIVVATGFFVYGAGVQHAALLQRQMRFTALVIIDILSLIIGIAVAIGMAMAGYGYWALVGNIFSRPFITTLGLWLVTRWVPGMPRRGAGIRPMVRFGGTMTLNGLVSYATFNFQHVLLGRFWGADALGLYGRASQLIGIPVDNLNGAVGSVAFAALSRLQDDPERLKRYFMKGYSLVVALTLPATIGCALFSDDLISVLLGPKWNAVAELFRILAPTILVFAIANPLGWLLSSLGLVERSLKIALVFAPFMIVGCVIGLPYGPRGMAIAYSTVMTLGILPISAWALHGTVIRVWDILLALRRPLVSSAVAAGAAFGLHLFYGSTLSLLPRLLLESTLFGTTYLGVLLFVAGRRAFHLDLLH